MIYIITQKKSTFGFIKGKDGGVELWGDEGGPLNESEKRNPWQIVRNNFAETYLTSTFGLLCGGVVRTLQKIVTGN